MTIVSHRSRKPAVERGWPRFKLVEWLVVLGRQQSECFVGDRFSPYTPADLELGGFMFLLGFLSAAVCHCDVGAFCLKVC